MDVCGDLDVELNDAFQSSTITVQFAAFVPVLEATAPPAGYLAPHEGNESYLQAGFT